MSNFQRMVKGKQQWTHPDVRRIVLQTYTDLRDKNDGHDLTELWNAAVGITRVEFMAETKLFKYKWGLQ